MKIKGRFPNEKNQFEVKTREDIENIEWVKTNWMHYPEFNLVWNHNPGLINPHKYPTLIMAEFILENGKKETHTIFLCEGMAEELGLEKWSYDSLKR